MDEDTASKTILLETRGAKEKKDTLELARAAKYFVDLNKGSYPLASEYIYNHYKYRITERTLRRLASLLRLPREVQEQLSKKQIRVDVATQLAESKLDNETKIKISKIISGMKAHDAREVIQFATKYPEASIEEYKERVLAAKPRQKKLFVVVIPLDELKYGKLKKKAEGRHLSIHGLCNEIIENWLQKQEEQT